ncbi:MAG: RluA family pseudouridine synthase [bacterium]
MAIEEGRVTVNNHKVKPSYKVKGGEVVKLIYLARPPLELTPEPIPLNILYEDEWLIVVDKPAGMVVHPAKGNRSGTLVNALLAHYQIHSSYKAGETPISNLHTPFSLQGDPDRPGIVHRLDKETSGVLVVCKREPAMSRLSEQFRNRNVERRYLALTWWHFPSRKGVIDAPIGRDPRDRKKYTVTQDGKPAKTHWVRLETFDFLSLLSLRLETGRTHQIRVHLSHISHPVFGDPDYGGRNRQMGKLSTLQRSQAAQLLEMTSRQLLHAQTLGFHHPITGRQLQFESPLPPDFQSVLNYLRNKRDG